MNLSEFIFILQFLTYVVIFLSTLYNVFSVGKFYDMRMVWILFVAQLINYYVSMSVVLTLETTYWEATEIIGTLYDIQVAMFELYFVMLIIQLFFYWKSETVRPVKARNSLEMRER